MSRTATSATADGRGPDAHPLPIIGVRLAEGRVGSTLLMQLLATSPAVVFDHRYPAEYRFASYFARVADAVTEPFDARRHVGVTPFFFGESPAWGPVPFVSDVVDVTTLGPRLLRSMWAAWSDAAIERQPDARCYAEKLAVPIDPLRAAGLDVRVIDLVRDPRDMLASIRAFTARGIDGFGRRAGQDEDAWLADLVARLRTGYDRIVDTPGDVDHIVLRYEDLVGDLHGVAKRLGAWLGADAGSAGSDAGFGTGFDADVVIAQRADVAHHMTAPSVAASVGRWRRDLPTADAERLSTALADHLERFGYDRSV